MGAITDILLVEDNKQLLRQLWVPLVKYRANYKCEDCGKKNCKLDSHHIDGNNENNCLKNGECLCVSCHLKKSWIFDDSRKEKIAKTTRTDKRRKEISEQFKGKPKSESHKKKIGDGNRIAWSPEGTRRK